MWSKEYLESLNARFQQIILTLDDKVETVDSTSVAPSIDSIKIGSAKKAYAAVLFFDIRNFTGRTSSDDEEDLKKNTNNVRFSYPNGYEYCV